MPGNIAIRVNPVPPLGEYLPVGSHEYYLLKSISQPAVSPDGRRVAYVVKGYRKKQNDSYSNLWLAPTDGSAPPIRLTRGNTGDGWPAWSPDGRYLAFISTREYELEVAQAIEEEQEK